MKNNKEHFMSLALKEAKKALILDEVPIGCVIVKDNKVIAKGFNKRETLKLVSGHAEMIALTKANNKLGDWRLPDCDLYVTVEPCIMCGGALMQSRIKNIYYGAKNDKGGAFGSSINLLEAKNVNHYPNIEGGILLDECTSILKEYFKTKRNKR